MTGQHVGIVTNYDPALQAASVRLGDLLRLGDRVAIRGTNGGVKLCIDNIECERRAIRVAEPGQNVTIRVPRDVAVGSLVLMELEAPWP